MKLRGPGTLRSRLRVALLPLLVLAALPTPGLALCALSDAQHHACCCPGHAAQPTESAQLSRSCCCKLEQANTHSQPSTALRANGSAAHALALGHAEATGVLPRLRGTLACQLPLREARSGPKLFILHRSFLI